jgi:hypothetical protein
MKDSNLCQVVTIRVRIVIQIPMKRVVWCMVLDVTVGEVRVPLGYQNVERHHFGGKCRSAPLFGANSEQTTNTNHMEFDP